MVIRHMGPIGETATVARYLPTHRRGRSIQSSSDLTKRRTRSDPSRYILSLTQGERQTRTTAIYGRNPSGGQQQTSNRTMGLIKSAPNLVQRLSGLPPSPDRALLGRRKSKPLSRLHATPPLGTDLHRMVLHRPIETTAFIRHMDYRPVLIVTIPAIPNTSAYVAKRNAAYRPPDVS
jgi:hypothetical protein